MKGRWVCVWLLAILIFTCALFTQNAYANNQDLRQEIVRTALHLKGVSYRWGGTTPAGFDCSGFVQYVYRVNGISIPRDADSQYYDGTKVSTSNLKPGDLVFFQTYESGPSHVGIYIGDNRFIHAAYHGGIMIDSLSEPYYAERYLGARTYIE
ncbi:NlpC/P60 family protein [Thermodesulfobium acidiphilum]|uniref:NlpC/P60 family protein n=1 Tax=Thermodesulfobium acidiphilum TaxID=1794699 RepID=A0A2R4VZ02_THEAF|nr:C40 family peptidase [Thermodesulfobium acidiphilum]AWB09676.1 NlpC/P60 family protein [Thermodesulfobium acidiphilum]